MVFNPNNVLMQNSKTGKVPVEQASLIIKEIVDTSVVTKLAKYEPMEKLEKEFTYLAEGPGAYWVEEGQKIQTDTAKWLNIKMVAKKLAVILPVSKESITYSVPEFFNLMKPKIAEAFQNKFDMAALFGKDSPYATGISIYERANASGNKVQLGTGKTLYEDLNAVMALVEDGDNEPLAFATTRRFNKNLRGAVDANNLPIFNATKEGVTASALGLPLAYGSRKAWDYDKVLLFTGDFDHAFYGIPQNIEYAIDESATLSTIVDEKGEPINLFERDMVALRATMYIGFMTVKEDAFAMIVPKTEGAGA